MDYAQGTELDAHKYFLLVASVRKKLFCIYVHTQMQRTKSGISRDDFEIVEIFFMAYLTCCQSIVFYVF